jgi:D-glycero-alpha-D-manno-heptose-7-phosphate kinase
MKGRTTLVRDKHRAASGRAPLKAGFSKSIEVSCPGRVDIGNSLDYPHLYLSLGQATAHTVNIAVDLRTTVRWEPSRRAGMTLIVEGQRESHRGVPDPSRSRFPLLSSLTRHFELTAGVLSVSSRIPVGSGLGGSGVLLVALFALVQKATIGTLRQSDWPSLAMSAHLFENWLGFSASGFHDQLAALYGGANQWTWGTHFRSASPVFKRLAINPAGGAAAISRHILLCFTGQPHAKIRRPPDPGWLPTQKLQRWREVSELTTAFAKSLRQARWTEAARYLNDECSLREQIRPACLSARARLLVDAARSSGVGCRYTGHGHGGCVWAIGERRAIERTSAKWTTLSASWNGAWVLRPAIAERGLMCA